MNDRGLRAVLNNVPALVRAFGADDGKVLARLGKATSIVAVAVASMEQDWPRIVKDLGLAGGEPG